MVSPLRVPRAGHSLPELVVAVTFLGATLGVVGASAALAARQVAEAALRHEALREAAAVLDSLAAAAVVAPGTRVTPRLLVGWAPQPRPGGPGIRVTVVARSGGRSLASLVGAVPPVLDTFPAPAGSAPGGVP